MLTKKTGRFFDPPKGELLKRPVRFSVWAYPPTHAGGHHPGERAACHARTAVPDSLKAGHQDRAPGMIGTQQHPKTDVVIPVIGIVVVADGTAQIFIIVVPRAAAQGDYSVWAPFRFNRLVVAGIFHPTAQHFTQLGKLAAAKFIRL